jgi:hypothetical protein
LGFEGGPCKKNTCFRERFPNDLQTNGQPSGSFGARNRECRQTENIQCANETGRGHPRVFVNAIDFNRCFSDPGRHNRRSRSEDKIDPIPEPGKLFLHHPPQPLRVYVIRSRKQPALVQKQQHIRAKSFAIAKVPLH